MTTLARMEVDLVAKVDKLLDGLNTSERRFKSFTSSVMSLGKALAAGWLTKEIIQNTAEAENAVAQLNAAIKSTGGVAGFTTEQLLEQASAMQKVSTFSDEAVANMQSVLLTFTQVRGDNFTRASAAIADMATRLGTDLKSAAIQVGKALQDPEKGVTALARAGVQFSQSQKDAIAKMLEVGNTAAAQVIILKELETQFGGSAAAARDTLGGALTAVKNAFGDALEAGGQFSGGLTSMLNAVAEAIPKVRGFLDDFIKGVQLLALEAGIAWAKFTSSTMQAIGRSIVAVGKFADVLGNLVPSLKLLSAPAIIAGQKILAENVNETTAAMDAYRKEQEALILGMGRLTKATATGIVTGTQFGTVVDATAASMRKAAAVAEEYAKHIDHLAIADLPMVGGSVGERLLTSAIDELPPLEEWRADVSRNWTDSVKDFIDGFVNIGEQISDKLKGVAQEVGGWFGNMFGSLAGTSFAAAFGPIVNELLGSLFDSLTNITTKPGFGWELVGTTPSGAPIFKQVPLDDGSGGLSGRDDSFLSKTGPKTDGTAAMDRITTVTSHAATATLQQENRLIGLVSTLLSVEREGNNILRAILGQRPVFENTANDRSNLSTFLAGDAIVAT